MVLLSETIDEELPDLAKQGVPHAIPRRRDRIEPWLEQKMRLLEARTALSTRSISGSRSTTAGGGDRRGGRRLIEDGVPAEASTRRRSPRGSTRRSSPRSTS
jgi:hypothetical protein